MSGQDRIDRWIDGLVSLGPRTPDGARFICTSTREVPIAMIDHATPVPSVTAANPECAKTGKGVPTRRAKVSYLLPRKGVGEEAIESLVEEDMDNALTLFHAVNDGTHGQPDGLCFRS